MIRLAAVAVICWAVVLGAQQEYVGARVCAGCHATQSAEQSKSGHAGALKRAVEHPMAAAVIAQTGLARAPRFRFQFRQEDNSLRVRATDGAGVTDIPVEWAFGAGKQAVTFVTRVNKDWYLEHYFSYYPAMRRMGPTPGQGAIRAETIEAAMGLLYKTLDPAAGIIGCFECHSTGPAETAGGQIRPAELGVRCEACHGPGAAHVKTPARGSIRNPGRMPAKELNSFCGRCHRPPAATGVEIDWNYPWNVRHAPVYFSQSACFRKSGGGLSCLTCHEPHQALRRDASYYRERCSACHNRERRPPKAVCGANCVDCHMPRVSPQAGLSFTNHWIGVYGEGAKLKPRGASARNQ